MRYFLRTSTKEDMATALESVDFPKNTIIDVIGAITKFTGKYTVIDGEEVPEMFALDGYHVNLLFSDKPSQKLLDKLPIIPEPDSPYRVFAK